MNIFYLASIILGVAAQNIIKKPYTDKTGDKGVYFFSGITSLAAMLFFIVSSGGIEWNSGILPYSAGFALSYTCCTVFTVIAIASGSLSLTSLIIQYSLMLPTVYGLIFLKDSIGKGFIPGIVLLIISLVLINKKSEEARFSFKWIISVLLAFFGNGMCSVVQKMQQVKYDGAYKNEFMIAALAMVVIVCGILSIAKEKRDMKLCIKSGWLLGLICGVMNGIVNLFVMILSGKMPVALMFPLISAGGIIVTYIVSRFFYKEKLTKMQFAGFILGIASVVFLNI